MAIATRGLNELVFVTLGVLVNINELVGVVVELDATDSQRLFLSIGLGFVASSVPRDLADDIVEVAPVVFRSEVVDGNVQTANGIARVTPPSESAADDVYVGSGYDIACICAQARVSTISSPLMPKVSSFSSSVSVTSMPKFAFSP